MRCSFAALLLPGIHGLLMSVALFCTKLETNTTAVLSTSLTGDQCSAVAVDLVGTRPNFDESRWGIHHLFAGKSITGKNRSMFTSRSQFCRRAVIWGAALDSKH